MDKSVPRGQLSGVVTPPCSKSYAQRALAAALLAEGKYVMHHSRKYNRLYAPHYRIVSRKEYEKLKTILK